MDNGRLHLVQTLLILCANVAFCSPYYITPSDSPYQSCSQQNSPCLSLSQFAADLSESIHDLNISLLFLPGNHFLDQELLLTNKHSFSASKYGDEDATIFVECLNDSAKFIISKVMVATIKDLHFIGCGDNRVSHVSWLTISGTTFQDVANKSTVLMLSNVSTATIAGSYFLSNTLSTQCYLISNYFDVLKEKIPDYVFFQQKKNHYGIVYIAFSKISVISSQFMKNKADVGGALVARSSSVHLARCTFSNNTASFGGAMVTSESIVNIDCTSFTSNRAEHSGGVMVTYNDTLITSSTTFTDNSAQRYGGVMLHYGNSSITVRNCTFKSNVMVSIFSYGGVIMTFDRSSITIDDCTFTQNSAVQGGVIATNGNTDFHISTSYFDSNHAAAIGGVLLLNHDSMIIINDSIFSSNWAARGGVFESKSTTLFAMHIGNSLFINNSALKSGGVIDVYESRARWQIYSSISISNSTFIGNRGDEIILCLSRILLTIDSSKYRLNVAFSHRGIIVLIQCPTNITNSVFESNAGFLYTFNSNLTLNGETILKNSTSSSKEGGVITSYLSTVTVSEGSILSFSNNQAITGRAILAIESTVTLRGKLIIANYTAANGEGGGISLKQSRLEIRGNCDIVNNSAAKGGGIHAYSSTITVYKPGTLHFVNNSAQLGGALFLELYTKLYILRTFGLYVLHKHDYDIISVVNLFFIGNYADYGGAVYVADDTSSDSCSPDVECFVQVLALYQFENRSLSTLVTESILFSDNKVSEKGRSIFGGLLDRCILSSFSEVHYKDSRHYSGMAYWRSITFHSHKKDVSSQPVRVCFCNRKNEPDCSYHPPTIRVQKGQAFNVSLVAVDQVNHTVQAKIDSFLPSSDGGFAEGQQSQTVQTTCTNLTFNLFSPTENETLHIYPDGPCGSAELSTSQVTVLFTNCACPIGFEPLSNSQTRCECICDTALAPYITNCTFATSSVIRESTNSWITYNNDTDSSRFLIYPNCPFDYCRPKSEKVFVNFNLPNGADSQCAFERSGTLCGSCKEGLSLSLASSRCVSCHAYWPAIFVLIVLAATIAGILLVMALLALNMTVSVGLINGFIFYVNIVSPGNAIFFPSSEPSFSSVFVAWLNLDIGIDVCFIDGLDTYTKTWLQLLFPLYIISLVLAVIKASEYSFRFARLIGKKDPVSTLATLVLLSYAKLLSTTITALSPATLRYPDGKTETVWLPDGNVRYLMGKHIPLVVAALLIITVGLPYTLLLFLWQWIIRASKWKLFKWIGNTKLHTFMSTYHVPYNSRYRFWTGLLLLVRVVLYITASVTLSDNPQTLPLITLILVGMLVFLSKIFALKVYKSLLVEAVNTVLYFNLLFLCAFTLYDFKGNIVKQTAVAYTSIATTFILFVGVLFYHVAILIKKQKSLQLKDSLAYPLVPNEENTSTVVTHSVVEIPRDEDQPQANETDGEN